MAILYKRKFLTYFVLVIIVMLLGLSSRYFSAHFPKWINLYLGDILWALMIYLLFGLLFRSKQIRWIAAAALLFSFSIELSQLYHSQWIDNLRATGIGGLVLGYGFLWSDLLSYSIGIGIGIFLDKITIHFSRR